MGRLTNSLPGRILFLAMVIGGVFWVRPGHCHDVDFSSFSVVFMEDGTYRLDVEWDADAFLLDVKPGHVEEEDLLRLGLMAEIAREARLQALRRMFQVRIKLRFDGEIVRHEVALPNLGEGRWGSEEPGPSPGKLVRLEGVMPEGARSFVFWASRSFGVVTLSLSREGEESERQILQVSDRSDPFLLDRPRAKRSWLRSVFDFVVLGFEHILPKGLDHILFVLGLFFLGLKLKPLLWQVTAFTIAHSVTLGLSMYGVVSLPSSIVEPLIALSIAYVAIENIFTVELKPWRPTVVFTFGLLHGLGFAGVLSELGLPSGEFVAGLIGFNVGVELGQLTVIGLAFLGVGWFRGKAWYRSRVIIPASALIALAGIYWVIERTLLAS